MRRGRFIVKMSSAGDTSDPRTMDLVSISWRQRGYDVMKSNHIWQDFEEGKWSMLVIPRSQAKELVRLLKSLVKKEAK